MTQVEEIRNSIIDKLLSIENPELLAAINKILEANSEVPVKLNASQRELLQLSEEDIQYGRLISQEELEKQDEEWVD